MSTSFHELANLAFDQAASDFPEILTGSARLRLIGELQRSFRPVGTRIATALSIDKELRRLAASLRESEIAAQKDLSYLLRDQAWTEATQLELAMRFIQETGHLSCFVGYLNRILEDESLQEPITG